MAVAVVRHVCEICDECVKNYRSESSGVNLVTVCGYFVYHRVGHSAPHSCIYVFCVDLRTNTHYFPIQH